MIGIVIAFIFGSTVGSLIFLLALCIVSAFRDD